MKTWIVFANLTDVSLISSTSWWLWVTWVVISSVQEERQSPVSSCLLVRRRRGDHTSGHWAPVITRCSHSLPFGSHWPSQGCLDRGPHLGELSHRIVLTCSSGGWKSTIKASAGWVPSEGWVGRICSRPFSLAYSGGLLLVCKSVSRFPLYVSSPVLLD